MRLGDTVEEWENGRLYKTELLWVAVEDWVNVDGCETLEHWNTGTLEHARLRDCEKRVQQRELPTPQGNVQ